MNSNTWLKRRRVRSARTATPLAMPTFPCEIACSTSMAETSGRPAIACATAASPSTGASPRPLQVTASLSIPGAIRPVSSATATSCANRFFGEFPQSLLPVTCTISPPLAHGQSYRPGPAGTTSRPQRPCSSPARGRTQGQARFAPSHHPHPRLDPPSQHQLVQRPNQRVGPVGAAARALVAAACHQSAQLVLELRQLSDVPRASAFVERRDRLGPCALAAAGVDQLDRQRDVGGVKHAAHHLT